MKVLVNKENEEKLVQAQVELLISKAKEYAEKGVFSFNYKFDKIVDVSLVFKINKKIKSYLSCSTILHTSNI